MNTKVNEGKLISKKQAATAFIDGEDVEFMDQTGQWRTILDNTVLKVFLDRAQFRIKPRTITLNGIEVPAPFEPKEEDQYWYLDSNDPQGYNADIKNHEEMFSQFKKTAFCQIGLWRTEEEIKQVVAALRQVFGGSHDN